jgi:hypothetical protein
VTVPSALEQFFADLADEGGTAPLGDAEAEAVLDLTRVVAHTSERRYAPLTAYALALTMAAEAAPEQRTARVRALIDTVRGLGHGQ